MARLAQGAEHREDVGLPGQPGRADDDSPVGAEHQRGRGPADPDPAHQVQMRLGVDVDLRHAVYQGGYVGEHPPGRPAGRAERGREVDQRCPAAQRHAEVVSTEPAEHLSAPPGMIRRAAAASQDR